MGDSARGIGSRFVCVAAVVAACHGVAVAQGEPGGLERVDPGVGDVGPLGESLRLLPVDLRISDGFENVYRVTDARGESRFVRRDGALLAVFSRSDYVSTGSGTIPVIPSGTRFLIGEPIGAQAAALGLGDGRGGFVAQSALARSRRVDLRAGGETRPAPPRRERTTPTPAARADDHLPWRSDRDRGARIAGLLASAAASD